MNSGGWRAAGERLASGWQRLQLARRTETQRTAHRYAQTAQRTARSQSCGLSTGTYGYQTRHTHGRYVPPPGLPGRRSASATLLLPHTEQTRVPGAGHAAWLRCLPLMSLMASVRRSLPTLTHMYMSSRIYGFYLSADKIHVFTNSQIRPNLQTTRCLLSADKILFADPAVELD